MIDVKANVAAKSNVTIYIHNREGLLVGVRKAKNLVVNSGLQLIRDLYGGYGSRVDQMQAGFGTTPTTAGMTALESWIITKDITRRVRQTFGIEIQALIGFSEANGYDISEIGSFQQGTLVNRAILDPVIPKTALLQITMSHVTTFEAA